MKKFRSAIGKLPYYADGSAEISEKDLNTRGPSINASEREHDV